MATTEYDDRILLIEVSGLRQQGTMPTSHYTFKVPYRSLARTLQFISRKGGKVIRIQAPSLLLPTPASWNHATSLANPGVVEAIAAHPSSTFDPDPVLALENAPTASETTQPTVVAEAVAEADTLTSLQPSEPRLLEPLNVPKLIRSFLKKLNHTWVKSE
ncbi:MAG: hypothetical protein KME45_09310 [Stenomitos rutilans HA7619-LM2]|jgi:hypothetical protein|nr:hypothetical protein [Stenomitos rutilans HA7619-LM2]